MFVVVLMYFVVLVYDIDVVLMYFVVLVICSKELWKLQKSCSQHAAEIKPDGIILKIREHVGIFPQK